MKSIEGQGQGQGQLFAGHDATESSPGRKEGDAAPAERAERAEKPRGKLRVRINFDGASKGNPGPASIGAVIAECPHGRSGQTGGEVLIEISESIGRATNNFAEYSGLIRGLEKALELGAVSVECVSDSELVVRQMTGKYRVKSESLRPLWQKARELSRRFDRFSIKHVPRSENQRADRLASEALKTSKKKT